MSLTRAVQWLGDKIGDGLRAVGDVAGDAIRAVGKGIQKLGDFAGDTIKAIIKDPLPTLLSYAGTFIGIPPYVTSSVITAAKGGNLEDIAKSAAISYATTSFMSDTQIGADIKNYTVNQWSGDFTDSMMEKFNLPADTAVQISKVASASLNSSLIGGINAALSGKSIATGISSGFTSGLIYSSTDSYFDSIKKNPNWGLSATTVDLMKGATSTALNTIVSGKGDPAQAVGNYIAYASLNMAGSSLFNKAKETYQSLTKSTTEAEKAQEKYAAEKSEYDKQLKAAENLRNSVNADTAAYQKTIDEKYTPFKNSYDKLIADNDAQAKIFNEQKKIFDANKAAYDANPSNETAAAANAAADAANAAADRSAKIQEAATKLYNDNKPMLDSLTIKSAEIDKNIKDFNAIKSDIETPKGRVGEDPSMAAAMARFKGFDSNGSPIYDNTIPIPIIDNRNLAQRLKDASNEYQNKYDLWSATKSEAEKSAEDYTKALAEVATRDATIDAINSGVITATKQDDDGNWVLSNNMTLTKDGKFVQDGVQQFTNAAGINQKPMDLTSADGSKIDFSEDAGRLLSTSDVQNIVKRDYGIDITDQDAKNFTGKPYTELGNPELYSFVQNKVDEQNTRTAVAAGFPNYQEFEKYRGDLEVYKASLWKPEDTSMAGGEQTAALSSNQVAATDAGAGRGTTVPPTRYVPTQNVDANNKNAIAASDALSAMVGRDGAPKNATISPVYVSSQEEVDDNGKPTGKLEFTYYSDVTSSDIDGNAVGYRMIYDPVTKKTLYTWSGQSGEGGVNADGTPNLATVYVNASTKPPSLDATTGEFVDASGKAIGLPGKIEYKPTPSDAVIQEKSADTSIFKNPFSFDSIATLMAVNNDGTSLVKNDSTGAQSIVKTTGNVKVGSKVDLTADPKTGEIIAVVKTPDVTTPEATTPEATGTAGSTAGSDNAPVATEVAAGSSAGAGSTSAATGTTGASNAATGSTSSNTGSTAETATNGTTSSVAGTIVGTTGNATGVSGVTTDASNETTGSTTGSTAGGTTGSQAGGNTSSQAGTGVGTNELMSKFNARVDQLIGGGKTSQEAISTAAQEIELGLSDIQKSAFEQEKAAQEKNAADKAEAAKVAAANLAFKISTNQSSAKTSNTNLQNAGMQAGLSLLNPAASSDVANTIAPLTAGYLTAGQLTNQFESPLAKFLQTQDQQLGHENEFGTKTQGKPMNDLSYSYGTEKPIQDILNMGASHAPDASTQNYTANQVAPYAKGGMAGTRHGKYAQGGLSTPLMASGGKMRVDFRHGDAVTGAGDGQSDDIPAMLADGEFVFPADVVAAIGNGSTKAGSDKLYDMMHGIRAHARSAKPKDLPPQIKSPLDFLKRS